MIVFPVLTLSHCVNSHDIQLQDFLKNKTMTTTTTARRSYNNSIRSELLASFKVFNHSAEADAALNPTQKGQWEKQTPAVLLVTLTCLRRDITKRYIKCRMTMQHYYVYNTCKVNFPLMGESSTVMEELIQSLATKCE